jgi:RND family efflux transporter MFP subunit
MKKAIVTVIFVIAAVILGIKGKGLLKTKENEIKNEKPPIVASITVPVVKAKDGVLEKRVSYIAQIIADKSIKLSTKLAGYIQKVYVSESQKVKKGELLVKIDSVELKSSIKALKSTLSAQKDDLKLAKSIYDRNIKLYEIGGLAKEKLDISKVAVDSKKALIENSKQKIDQLRHQLSYLKIVAPFDGEIDTLFLHEGDLAAAGKPILSMSNAKKRLVISYAPSKKTKIEKNQKVLLDNKEIGYVNFIYTTSKNGLTSAEVKLTKNIDLPTGSNLGVELLVKRVSGCVINDNTILHKKDGTFVMVYNGKTFSPLKVDVKMKEGNLLIVTPCPNAPIAQASEARLAELPAYDKVSVIGDVK